MPLFLRIIRKYRWLKDEKMNWLPEYSPSVTPLAALQADALIDLKTEDNRLSVWHIEDGELNLPEVVAAVAANRERIDPLDYALFDQGFLTQNDVKVDCTKGATISEKANHWHRDLIELSVDKVVALAATVAQEPNSIRRVSPAEIRSLVKSSLQSGQLDAGKMKPTLHTELFRDASS